MMFPVQTGLPVDRTPVVNEETTPVEKELKLNLES